MKTVIQTVLKLWSFEVVKHNGSHFEKMALKGFMYHFVVFLSSGSSQSAKLPDSFHGNTLDMLAYAEAQCFIFYGSLCGES